jgi:hypothetical protein
MAQDASNDVLKARWEALFPSDDSLPCPKHPRSSRPLLKLDPPISAFLSLATLLTCEIRHSPACLNGKRSQRITVPVSFAMHETMIAASKGTYAPLGFRKIVHVDMNVGSSVMAANESRLGSPGLAQ